MNSPRALRPNSPWLRLKLAYTYMQRPAIAVLCFVAQCIHVHRYLLVLEFGRRGCHAVPFGGDAGSILGIGAGA